jgi:acyl-homoserine-lactone acylase
MRPLRCAAPAALALALLSACGGGGDAPGPAPLGPNPLSAEIRRTSFGVPHIVARDETGLGYGIGYAYASDNFCVLADEIVTINGERSRWFGASNSNIYRRNNLRSDIYFKLINDDAAADDTWNRQSDEVKALYTGYVAGVNRYLREKGAANLPADCKGAGWVRPITTRDMARLIRRLSVEASGINFVDAIAGAQPPVVALAAAGKGKVKKAAVGNAQANAQATQARTMLAATDGPLSREHWQQLREHTGSNALALGADATEDGRGLLFGNPHFPWFGILRFFQMHLTIPGKLDAMGAALGGSTAINIGFNREIAWSHTVNTSTHFTLFVLTLDPADPTRYVYDGVSRPMVRKSITVQTLQADGSLVPVTRDFYSSSHGPILVIPGQLEWNRQVAFALRDANLENWRLVEHFYRGMRAGSLDDYKRVVENLVGLPWVNSIAVDRGGNTYYADITPVPRVTAAQESACIAAPFRPLIARDLFVLAGSTAACEWTIDPAAPQPGIYSGAELPKLSRRDYVHNANDSAWLSNPAVPIAGFPAIVSRDSNEQNGRTRIGLAQAQARLAGSDGRPGNKFNAETLKSMVLSNRVYYAEVALTDMLAAACGTTPGSQTVDGRTIDLAPPCAVLSAWDRRAELTSVGVPLFEAFWARARPIPGLWATPFSAADPVNTPRGAVAGNATVTTALRDALARAVIQLQTEGIAFNRPWYETQIASKPVPIPIHGATGTPMGIYNAISSSVIGSRAPGLRAVTTGTSYIQVVRWEGADPKVDAFLSYSNAADAAAANHADQTLRFSNKEWIRLPFTDAEIGKDPNFRSTVISE